MEINSEVEQRVRAALVERMGSKVRLTSSGDIHPDEARTLESMVKFQAATAGYELHRNWRIVVEFDLPSKMLNLATENRLTLERASLSDSRVWLVH